MPKVASPEPAAFPASPDLAAAIQTQIDGREEAVGALPRIERDELHELYGARGFSPVWLDAAGRPSRNARDALALLNAAADDGLDPANYPLARIHGLAAAVEGESLARDVAAFDVMLSAATLRHLRDLHLGQVDPHTVGLRLNAPERHNFAALLGTALESDRVIETAAGLRPQLAQYQDLRSMLVRYRALAADAAFERPPAVTATVHPGELYQGVGILHRQLVALGDLPADTAAPQDPPRYEGLIVEGVQRFQRRHGLEPDGALGKRTLAALQVPMADRVRQIELALERLRWLPDLDDERLIAINIPMFRLWAWDAIPSTAAPSFDMDVIVGRALNTQTPVFVEEMREVIFRPYWNVPRSILRHEILPMIERDAGYLSERDMEIVRGPGDDAQPVPVTPESLAELRLGVLRVRQRPGPRNSLGLVKFVFPNKEDVYMHGTPAQELFSRSRRDFSHGCVRVQDPVALAEWVLKDRPEWNRDRILASMAASRSLHVKLPRPVRVILFYTTAVVMPEDGTIRFAEDIYGHDARLTRALATRRSS